MSDDDADPRAPTLKTHLTVLEVLVLELVRRAERDDPKGFDRLKLTPRSDEHVAFVEGVNAHLADLLERSRSAARRPG